MESLEGGVIFFRNSYSAHVAVAQIDVATAMGWDDGSMLWEVGFLRSTRLGRVNDNGGADAVLVHAMLD